MKCLSKQWAWYIALLALAGCAAATMKIPTDFTDMEVIDATNRSKASGAMVNESFSLGPYAISDVNRKWNSKSSRGIAGFSAEKSTGGYQYKFATAEASSESECLLTGSKKSVGLLKGFSMEKQASNFACSCQLSGRDAHVVLDAGNDGKFTGTLTTETGTYDIQAIYERDGAMSDGSPAGYRVDGEGIMGGVESLKPGRIWLSAGLSDNDRDDLSCLFAGLMLYQAPSDK
ncbi:MAG: hypothetical protein M0R76_13935 [Proteobacteria bacterium]|nr:hypothetical protein [Pseudomonadota bacterium]